MAKIISAVCNDGQTLDTALALHLEEIDDQRDRSLVQEVCFGVCRNYFELQHVLKQLVNKPIKEKDSDIASLILCGLYQLQFLSIPDHAAISETVAATRDMQKPWATSLVNAVLRRVQREEYKEIVKHEWDDVAKHQHPQWFIRKAQSDWPQQWQTILAGNNQRPPMHIRINRTHTTQQDFIRELQQTGIEAEENSSLEYAIHITKPVAVEQIPGFMQGSCSVQDFAAQQAALLLAPEPGDRVLDACAAPGGKTGHLLELCPNMGYLLAVDNSPDRCQLIEKSLQRLNQTADIRCADSADIETWWHEDLFDRVLLDVPCSASGVIRRHPDIKLLRREQDVHNLVKKQREILLSAWSVLRPGGTLLYSTCSIFHCENDMVIESCRESCPDMQVQPVTLEDGVQTDNGVQILPGLTAMDGFYYSLLQKKAP